jgi:hypothetical protein
MESQAQAPEPGKPQGVLLDNQAPERQQGGIMLGPETTGFELQVLQRMSHVPTGVVHLFDAKDRPLVSIRIRSVSDQTILLRVTSFVEGYSSQAIDTIELPPQSWAELSQLPTFFPEHTREIHEMTRAMLHVRVDDLDKKTEDYSTFPIWLLARTSAYNGIKDPATGQWIELWQYLAAWVTPFAEEVMELVRHAAGLHPQRMIAGYQEEAGGVEEQVKAVFNALKSEEILYVNSLLAFGAGEETRLQRVRLPREALNTKSANCIDGTVLMASALEAASLNPGVVVVPGHAFLGWEKGAGSGEWDYLETTMIGSGDFEAAQAYGRALAERYQAMSQQLGDARYFRLFSLADLRVNQGITPME